MSKSNTLITANNKNDQNIIIFGVHFSMVLLVAVRVAGAQVT